MRKMLLSSFILIMGQAVFAANCAPTATQYLREEDDQGVRLMLHMQCESPEGTTCIYLQNDLAAVTGLPISSSGLYRQDISSDGGRLEMSLKTALVDSLVDYKYIEVSVDTTNLTGTISYGARGLDPYKGIVETPKVTRNVSCSLAY